MLASLYAQVEFLKTELEEKNLLIRTLIIKDVEVLCEDYNSNNSSNTNSSSEVTENESIHQEEQNDPLNALDDGTLYDESEFFLDLYLQFIRDTEEERSREINIVQQLSAARATKHFEFEHRYHSPDIPHSNLVNHHIQPSNKEPHAYMNNFTCDKKDENVIEGAESQIHWKRGTCLIMGDSTLNGLQQELMGPRFIVRVFPGAVIKDFYDYTIPLLRKKPSYIILMIGTNDSLYKTSETLLVELLQLKNFIQQKQDCEVIISCPTYRFDEPKAMLTLRNLRDKLLNLNIQVISNANITDIHIGRRGLHLNEKGSGRLAVNYLSYIRRH